MDKPSAYLLKFGSKEEMARKEEEMSLEESARYAELQKSIWLGVLGMDKDGNKITDEPVKTRMTESMIRAAHAADAPVAVQAPTQAPPPPSPPPGRQRTKVYTSNGH